MNKILHALFWGCLAIVMAYIGHSFILKGTEHVILAILLFSVSLLSVIVLFFGER